MLGSRLNRLAENERMIREVNAEAALVAQDEVADPDEAEVEFFCACGRADCDERILLSVAEYESAHRAPHRFIVVPGHETPAVEQVVERHPTHLVVEKRPDHRREDPLAEQA